MKLELKHIVGYLPYELTGKIRNTIFLLGTYSNMRGSGLESRTIDIWLNESALPILRPLSDLKKEIEVNGEKFVPVKKLGYNEQWVGLKSHFENTEYLPYIEIQKLYEWHFDIHGLIENNLAIDINTL